MTGAQAGFLVAAAAAAAYGLLLEPRGPSLQRTLVKVAGAAALSIGARLSDAPTFLGLALALSAVGDAALAADPRRYLPAGLAALFGAHAAYAVLFAEIGRPSSLLSDPARGGLALAVAIAAGAAVARWWPRLGPLRAPAAGCAAVVAAMTALAAALPWSFWPATLGAELLAASDAGLALRLLPREGRPQRLAGQAAWWLYAAGQGCIAWSFIRPWSW